MEDVEDIEKLKAFLKLEGAEQSSVQQELAGFIGEASDDEESQDENFLEEVEHDLQENKKEFNATRRDCNRSSALREKELIQDCQDEAVKELMILNREKNEKLRTLAEKLYQLLIECRKQISEETKLNQNRASFKHLGKTYTWRLGYPYFKDAKNFGSPPNADVIKKQQNNELFVNHLPLLRKWSAQEQSILKGAVAFSYFKYNQKQLQQSVRLLKIKLRSADEEQKVNLEANINILEKKLEELYYNGECDPPPLGCNIGIDWESIANDDLKGKHTANECYSFWNIYLHPDINKSNWSHEEDENLKTLASENHYQNWDKIAAQLNTGRSGFTVFLHYYSALNEKFKKTRFDPEEDKYLLEVIDKCRVGSYIPWGRVSYFFHNRSRVQLYHRYRYFLQAKNIKKGNFTEAEDILLKLLVKKFGKNFSLCAKYMPNRTVVQIRNRYQSYLDRSICFSHYTLEDDLKILRYVAMHGIKSWGTLSENMNRTRAHVRQRYWSLVKWHESNPDKDISEISRHVRHNQHTKYRGGKYADVIFERFKDSECVPSLEKIERCIEEERLKENAPLTRKASQVQFDVIDTQLREIFKTSHKLKPSNKILSDTYIQQSAAAINIILTTLGANFLKNLTKEKIEEKSEKLDNVDIEILSHLLKEQSKQPDKVVPSTSKHCVAVDSSIQMKYVLPPNVYTLIGLRNLLIKYQYYKDQEQLSYTISKCFTNKVPTLSKHLAVKLKEDLDQMDPLIKAKVLDERKLFMNRFYSMFRWPAIVSLSEPNSNINPATYSVERSAKQERPVHKQHEQKLEIEKTLRVKGRPRKNKEYPKVINMNKARIEKMQNSGSYLNKNKQAEQGVLNLLNHKNKSKTSINSHEASSSNAVVGVSHYGRTIKRKLPLSHTCTSENYSKVKRVCYNKSETVNSSNISNSKEQSHSFVNMHHAVYIKEEAGSRDSSVIVALQKDALNDLEQTDWVSENENPSSETANEDDPSGKPFDLLTTNELKDIKEDIKILDCIIKKERNSS